MFQSVASPNIDTTAQSMYFEGEVETCSNTDQGVACRSQKAGGERVTFSALEKGEGVGESLPLNTLLYSSADLLGGKDMSEGANYEAILRELLQERENLDRMIAWVQAKAGKPADTTAPAKPPVWGGLPPLEQIRFPRIASDQFFKMSVPEAIRAFLNLQKRPQTAREITEGLQVGGLSHRAKDLYQTVFPTLQRMKSKGEVDKLANGEWGLSEWYSASRRGETENSKREPE